MFARPDWKSENILKAQSCPIFHGNHESFGRFTFTPSDLRAKWLHNEIKYSACLRAKQRQSKNILKAQSCLIFHGNHEKFGRAIFVSNDLRAKLAKLMKNTL